MGYKYDEPNDLPDPREDENGVPYARFVVGRIRKMGKAVFLLEHLTPSVEGVKEFCVMARVEDEIQIGDLIYYKDYKENVGMFVYKE